jgi:predicted phosphoribosyltransferase
MPVRRLPTTFTATRATTLPGVAGQAALSVARGTTVTALQAANALGRKLEAWVNRGLLVPNQTLYGQTLRRSSTPWNLNRTTPTEHYNPTEIRKMRGL